MKNILVLCTGNSARSILGEALLERLGEGRIRSFSAGSNPKGAVHSASLRLLKNKEYEIDGFTSKSWNVFAAKGAPALDIVITVCDSAGSETCPAWMSSGDVQPVQTHWGISNPANVEGDGQDAAFELAYECMKVRVEKLVDLDFEKMSRDDLKQALDKIGASSEGATDATVQGDFL